MRVFNFLYSIIMNEMAKHFTFTAWNIKTLLEHVKVRYLHIPITMHYFSDHISVTPTCCAVSDSLSLSSRWIIAARSSSHILISSSMRAWNSSDWGCFSSISCWPTSTTLNILGSWFSISVCNDWKMMIHDYIRCCPFQVNTVMA